MGTHPIFESDFDCLTECDFPFERPPLLLLVLRTGMSQSLMFTIQSSKLAWVPLSNSKTSSPTESEVRSLMPPSRRPSPSLRRCELIMPRPTRSRTPLPQSSSKKPRPSKLHELMPFPEFDERTELFPAHTTFTWVPHQK